MSNEINNLTVWEATKKQTYDIIALALHLFLNLPLMSFQHLIITSSLHWRPTNFLFSFSHTEPCMLRHLRASVTCSTPYSSGILTGAYWLSFALDKKQKEKVLLKPWLWQCGMLSLQSLLTPLFKLTLVSSPAVLCVLMSFCCLYFITRFCLYCLLWSYLLIMLLSWSTVWLCSVKDAMLHKLYWLTY